MEKEEKAPLRIYRASAGSGKTFTLAVEYIKLLVINAEEYRHILAVTFTNKATAEMKERILSTLYGLANGLSGAKDHKDVIMAAPEIKALNLSDEKFRARAAKALNNIAHDYSRFRIETIDSFFLSVIKDLAHELGLNANLNIDLNTDQVVDEAVDNIISELTEDSETMKNIKAFIDEKIENNDNWKIADEVKAFGKNIFNEEYLQKNEALSDKLKDSKIVTAYKKKIKSESRKALEELASIGAQFEEKCKQHGLQADNFANKGRGIWAFFCKLSTIETNKKAALPNISDTTKKHLDGAEVWSKTSDVARELAASDFIPMLKRVVDLYEKSRKYISTTNAIYQNLNKLMLLHLISQKVDSLNDNANRFLIANSAHFLQRMIDGSNVPFIYEKSGSIFHHIMIDEFQDTSALQWSNFLPLITNCIDNQDSCLIVGDVKQSIYRFRNSDWRILNSLTELPELAGKTYVDNLEYNRRSLGNITDFNNAFFDKAVDAVNNEYKATHDNQGSVSLVNAYSDVNQKILEKKKGKGYVCVQMLQSGDGADALEVMNAQIVDNVRKLLDNGVQMNDIMILLRANNHIPIICNYFAENAPDINIVSDEAFLLQSSMALNILMLALKHIAQPDDSTMLARLTVNYLTQVKHTSVSDEEFSDMLLRGKDALYPLLPEAFANNIDKMLFEPLKELVEKLYIIFDLNLIPDQDAYLFSFHDKLAEFADRGNLDIVNFINHWDTKLSTTTIPNGSVNGVRIMSIHKSKGLEFPTVIMPYCEWSTSGRYSNLLWAKPNEKPYSELPLTPVNFVQDLKNSIFADEYEEEVLRNNVDNLNLLYVAFTRAKNNLIIMCSEKAGKESEDTDKKSKSKKPASTKENTAIKTVKDLIVKSMPDFMVESCDGDITKYEFGELVTNEKKEKQEFDGNVLEKEYEGIDSVYTVSENLPEFKQSNDAKDFIEAYSMKDEELDSIEDSEEPISQDTSHSDDAQSVSKCLSKEEEVMQRRERIAKGLLYHSILEQTKYADDLGRVIEKMYMEGKIRSAEERDEIKQSLTESLQKDDVEGWFDRKWKVINERAIIRSANTKLGYEDHRPDRVIISGEEAIVIDYKTGRYNEEHQDQVREYMSFMKDMGYKNVKGFVWYIMRSKIYRVGATKKQK